MSHLLVCDARDDLTIELPILGTLISARLERTWDPAPLSSTATPRDATRAQLRCRLLR